MRLAREPIRLFMVNGNTSVDVTERMAALGATFCGPAVDIEAATVTSGAPYVRTRAECVISARAVLETVRQRLAAGPGFDVCLFACFGEPGITAVREICPVPVVGMLEASVMSSLQMGSRFAIVTPGRHWPAMIREMLQGWCVAERCSAVLPVDLDAAAVHDDLAASRAAIGEAVGRAAATGADAVIVGGAAFAGMAAALRGTTPVRLVDSLEAGFAQAMALGRL